MTKTMLIDAAHAEETRVAVVDGNRIEELDFEIAGRRQLRGNIYLAKVVRVEPSLQAAFIEYGGNRHGFLAFNEIHPDYFQIPVADREALMREVADDDAREDAAEAREDAASSDGEEREAATAVTPDDDDDMEAELERRRRRLMRRYKIQEVIRRRQIMLVQVVKEERGNKGAALTTYLSLAGRYCVLMPNTARGGGISRKITNAADRKRLKSAVAGLDVPAGMGLIVRTAGAARTKTEIKRDYDYLLRLWENIRETTLKSIAPAQIYAEEDLVKRAIRDMYDKDIDQILVDGDAGYREARDFMRMIMPSQAKKVVRYAEPTPLFVKHKVEDQLAQIHSPVVPLKSGGYLVINQTEALVAIDVNSGRATRERNIETTAFKTNMEAAEEASRQLRLRDLAGLIVIDFIDMDEGKNNRAVEKKLKDCLKDDRARVQMGKISVFGLMEISRQRRRMGVLEGATNPCPTCHGVGRVRSVESSALSALRALDVEGARGAGSCLLKLPTEVALYVLNCKRGFLSRLEDVHGLEVTVAVDDHLAAGEHAIERTEHRDAPLRPVEAQTSARLTGPSPEDLADEAVEDEVEEDREEDEGGVEPRRAAAPRRRTGFRRPPPGPPPPPPGRSRPRGGRRASPAGSRRGRRDR
jgi:ribonuclease E